MSLLSERSASVPSYERFREQKLEIEAVLDQLRQELRRQPNTYHQIRNRTPFSIIKRYLYLTDEKKIASCLTDAKKLLEKYKATVSQ